MLPKNTKKKYYIAYCTTIAYCSTFYYFDVKLVKGGTKFEIPRFPRFCIAFKFPDGLSEHLSVMRHL